MKKINIADITLKKLSEDRAVSLLFREKAAIANCADAIGADVIELPAVKSLREDTIVYRTIFQLDICLAVSTTNNDCTIIL